MIEIRNIIPPNGEDFEKTIKELYEINGIPYDNDDSFWEVGNGENANFYIGDDDIELIVSSIKEESKKNVLKDIPVEMTLCAPFDVWNEIEKLVSAPYKEDTVYTFFSNNITGKLRLTYLDVMELLKHNSTFNEWNTLKKEFLCLPYAYRLFKEE